MLPSERELYMLELRDQAPDPKDRFGFTHEVRVRKGYDDPFPNNINQAIYWINTSPRCTKHRFFDNLGERSITFWFQDPDVAFEFKLRFA